MKSPIKFAIALGLGLNFLGCHPKVETIRPITQASMVAPNPTPTPVVGSAPLRNTELTLLPGPNAVPPDTRVVVNIPAFRMDVFADGAPVKSFRVGIGYPKYPLPTGLRTAQLIIFNPTWTPPDSPWVSSMNVSPGETVRAGSKLNPLGPIKIPIGGPSLIHGGKPLSKIGNFASHGCVGLTNDQVKDFAQVLVKASNTDLSNDLMSQMLNNRTRTKVVNLNKPVPVELRYETIVVQDGQLHIYRDVYAQNTNTEENLRAVLEANSIKLDDLSGEEKEQALAGLNQMSSHPKRIARTKAATATSSPSASPSPTSVSNESRKKETTTNQREIVIDILALRGKGYPAPVALNTGVATPGPND